MKVLVSVLICTMVQFVVCGDFFVLVKPPSERSTLSAREYLLKHLDLLDNAVPLARVYHVYWTLAERVGFFGFCVSIDVDSGLQVLNVSSNFKRVEPIGVLRAAGAPDFTMRSDKGIDETLNQFRKDRKAKSEVNIDSFYTTSHDSQCIYDSELYNEWVGTNSTGLEGGDDSPAFVYVVDTGIQSSHHFFKSRVFHGYDFENRSQLHSHQSPMMLRDPHGHGTQVAGLIHQVCSNAELIDVRVLGKSGYGRIDDIIKGLEFAVEHYFENINKKGRLHSVINLSISGKNSDSLRAVLFHISTVLLVIGASGDDDSFSCEVSPSSSEFILSAGGVTRDASLPLLGSNYGSCVGVRVATDRVMLPYIGESNEEMRETSGSSFAAAFISGVALRIISAIHSTPRATEVLYGKYPDFNSQRSIINFIMEMISLPQILTLTNARIHVVPGAPCALNNMTSITEKIEKILELNMQPVASSAGGRRALQRAKDRYKRSQFEKLKNNYI